MAHYKTFDGYGGFDIDGGDCEYCLVKTTDFEVKKARSLKMTIRESVCWQRSNLATRDSKLFQQFVT